MEKTAESPIIANTSALVSLATDTDQNHVPAKEAAASLRAVSRPIILPADIFVETVNRMETGRWIVKKREKGNASFAKSCG
jgi:hypothetical protein